MMKMKRVSLLGIGAIVLSAVVWLVLSQCDGKSKSDNSDWQTAVVERRDIGYSVLATGIIKPMVGAEVKVGSRVSGIVKKLRVRIGDFVQKGQVLAELDPTELQAKYDQTQAALVSSKVSFEYAKLDLERQRSLLEQKFISQNQLDLAEKAYQVAEAQSKQAEANLAYAKVQLDYTKIIAPISGVVASVSTQEGETVAASLAAPTFVTIIDLDRLEVWAYVDETDIGRIKAGQRAIFTVDTYPDTDFEGKVTAIYPKAEIQDNVVNYVTTIAMSDTKGRTLRPKMTTTVTIFLEIRQDVLTVPNGAIRREKGRKFVYVVQENQPVQRWVKVGWKDGGYTEVTDGLAEGERVILGDVDL